MVPPKLPSPKKKKEIIRLLNREIRKTLSHMHSPAGHKTLVLREGEGPDPLPLSHTAKAMCHCIEGLSRASGGDCRGSKSGSVGQ